MKNTLVIGCSHADCAYDELNRCTGPESWAWHLHQLRKDKEDFYVFSNPGQGIIQYGTIINYLDSHGLLKKFDNCIIQLTAEPRITLFKNDETSEYFASIPDWITNSYDSYNLKKFNSDKKVFSSTARELYNIYEKNTENSHKMMLADFATNISDEFLSSYIINKIYPIYYNYIINTLKTNNVKTVCFDFWGKILNDHVKSDELIIDSLMNLAKSKHMWDLTDISNPGGHHNSASNERLAKIINDEIIKSGRLE